ncbi:MAG: leucine-rich repeat protein [Clostridiales bacterium]|nr:leucine-rich repeat protein [Clostridiales bacterium]
MSDSLLNVILIAKKNTSLSFVRALQSVLYQTYTPIKVLVIDANEHDSLYSLGLQEDLMAFPEVSYLRLEPSLSIAAIRNHVLQSLEGDYIAYLNSSDVWKPDNAQRQISGLKENPEAGASCCNGILMDERKAEMEVEPLSECSDGDSAMWLLSNPARMSAQVIYRTDAIRALGGFDEQFVNFCDGDMLLRLSKERQVLLLADSLCECRITSDNETYDWDNFKDGQKVLYKYMDVFLVNKHMAQNFYGRMISLAGINYMWLNYFIYIYMYFIKAPARSIWMLMKKTGKLIYYTVKWNRRALSMFKEKLRIGMDIHMIRVGRLDGIKALKQVYVPEKDIDKPLEFSSAHEYNGKNSLDFSFDRNLESIVIPEYVTVIKKNMFYGCDRLVSVEIPNTVLEIQAHAFHMCRNLRYVTFSEGSRLGKIGEYAFAGCRQLKMISLPSNIVKIGKYAFAECCSLRQLSFTYLHHGEEKIHNFYPTAISKLPRYAFMGCTDLLSVEFGENSILEKLETGVFLGCTSLQEVVLASGIKALGNYAFAYCKELETVAIPQIDALKSIGKCAFMHCEALDYFLFPNQIERILMRTFYGCSNLKQVKIPKMVLSINHQAFAKCSSLSNAIIISGDTSISPTAFDRHTEVQIPGGENKDDSSVD